MITQQQAESPAPRSSNDDSEVDWHLPIAPRILAIGTTLIGAKAPFESVLADASASTGHSPNGFLSQSPPCHAFTFRCHSCGGLIPGDIDQIGSNATCPHCSDQAPVPLPGHLAAITQPDSDSKQPGPASLEAPPENQAPSGREKPVGLFGWIKVMMERRKERARLVERRAGLTEEISGKEEETRHSQLALGKFGWEACLEEELSMRAAQVYRELLAERKQLEEESDLQTSMGPDLEKTKSQGLADFNDRREPLLEEVQKRASKAHEAGRNMAIATSAWEEERDAATRLFEEIKTSSEVGIAVAGSEDLAEPLDSWITPFREQLVTTEQELLERESTLAAVHSDFVDAKAEVALRQLAVRETQDSLDEVEEECRRFEKDIDERVKASESALTSLESQLEANSKKAEEALVQIGTALFSLQPGSIIDSAEFAALTEAASELDDLIREARNLDRHIEQLH